jgi:hypothetical protein
MAVEAKEPQLVDLDELLDRLASRGVPQGSWLADIASARASLRQADGLLLRMQDAIVRGFAASDEIGV